MVGRKTTFNIPRENNSKMPSKNAKIDVILAITTFALVVAGLVMISSAGIARSLAVYEEPYYFFFHQLLYGAIPGIIIWLIFQNIDYHRWKRWSIPLFIISIILLIIVFIPGIGTTVKGAQRWIYLGGLSFQPTELMKLALILYLSAWLASRGKKIYASTQGFLGFLAILGLVGVLIIKQPDMGTLIITTIVACTIYFVSGAKIIFLGAIGGLGLFFLWVLIKIAPYRMDRIMSFLNPESDIQGKGYQINQALIALGSGGIFGLGLGHSRQKFHYLPEPVGDSIFAIVGEELGLIGCTVLVTLFLILAWRGFVIAKNAPDMFGKLLATGITTWFVFQSFINIAAISALIPLTGITIPFISYGGSSLIFAMAAMGILLNISKYSIGSKETKKARR